MVLRTPTPADQEAFLHAVARSGDLHGTWVSPPSTAQAYATFLGGVGDRLKRYLLTTEEGALVGVVNASEIVRGGFQSCYLGYYGFLPAVGTAGRMTTGLGLVLDHLFEVERLHRVEANIQPGNVRSLRLVQRLGFRQEGFSPAYLHIAGAWRDHERWALLATDARPPHPAPPA